jgi:alkyldihydroxyacetonephosphate synthase
MIEGMLGFEVSELHDAMPLDAVTLAPTRVAPPFEFCSIVPEDRVRHTYGRAYPDIVRGFRGEFEGPPDAVAFPETEQQVAALLDWASDHRIAVVPHGGGTSVVNGVGTAIDGDYDGVVTLQMRRLDRVLEIDEESLAAHIQAGATGPAIDEQLAEKGFTLRHFPQSYEFSTLGGWIATRAGGHFATAKTHIDDFVEATRMITPSGVMETRRLPASGAGPSPDRLVLGSEGILGVITDAWMRVQRRPTHKSTASWKFERWRDAVAAVRALGQSGLSPSNCRLLDRTEAMLNQVSFDGTHVLIVGFESAGVSVDDRMQLAGELCADHGGECPDGVRRRTPDDDERDRSAGSWRNAFFEGPYLQSALVTMGVMADTFESAITWNRFHEFHRGVKDAVIAALDEVCGGGMVSCRFTHVYPDGVAPYYTFIGPVKPGSELEQWREIKAAASDAVLKHGGTITHHHAVGRTHRPWYDEQRSDTFAKMLGAAKASVDPEGILNPGVLLD